MSELDDLFNMCLNSELPNQEKMSKQFDETFSYNLPKSKFSLSGPKSNDQHLERRNTIHNIQPRQFSLPRASLPAKQKQQKQRRVTVMQDAIIDLSRLRRQQQNEPAQISRRRSTLSSMLNSKIETKIIDNVFGNVFSYMLLCFILRWKSV